MQLFVDTLDVVRTVFSLILSCAAISIVERPLREGGQNLVFTVHLNALIQRPAREAG